jgi:hypothetical protein
MPRGASTASTITKAQRVKQFVSLRTQGLSYRAIADAWQKQTGKKISQTTVQTDIVAELKKIAEQTRGEAEHYQQIELTRLDMAMSAIAKKVAGGDVMAVSVWVRISESRRKLLGLDAPVQLQVQQQLATQQDQFINMLEAALDAETFAKVTAAAVAIAEASAAAETN